MKNGGTSNQFVYRCKPNYGRILKIFCIQLIDYLRDYSRANKTAATQLGKLHVYAFLGTVSVLEQFLKLNLHFKWKCIVSQIRFVNCKSFHVIR